MSLFETMSDLSKQHADTGVYQFTKPECSHCEGFGYIVDSQDIHHDCVYCNGEAQ